MKTVLTHPDIWDMFVTWTRSSPENAVIACFSMVILCWIISYFLKDLI